MSSRRRQKARKIDGKEGGKEKGDKKQTETGRKNKHTKNGEGKGTEKGKRGINHSF
jgi:hypothetical protein